MSCLCEWLLWFLGLGPPSHHYESAMTDEQVLEYLGAAPPPTITGPAPARQISGPAPLLALPVEAEPPASYYTQPTHQNYPSPIRYGSARPGLYDQHYCQLLVDELLRRRQSAFESTDAAMVAQIATLNQWMQILSVSIHSGRSSVGEPHYGKLDLFQLDWLLLYQHCEHVVQALAGQYQ